MANRSASTTAATPPSVHRSPTCWQRKMCLTVLVDNSINDRVYPQKADFTFYGGIYRDVSLLIVSKTISHWTTSAAPASGSPSVVRGCEAKVKGGHPGRRQRRGRFLRWMPAAVWLHRASGANASLELEHPHLWDGVRDPLPVHLRGAAAEEWADCGRSEDPGGHPHLLWMQKGFFLNGRPYPLHGVSVTRTARAWATPSPGDARRGHGSDPGDRRQHHPAGPLPA